MGEILFEFLKNISLGLIGLAIYSLYSVRMYLKVFSASKFFKGNVAFWIWASLLQIAVAGLLALEPDASEAIKTIVAIDFSEPMAFVTSGTFLSHAANMAVKEKIGKPNTVK